MFTHDPRRSSGHDSNAFLGFNKDFSIHKATPGRPRLHRFPTSSVEAVGIEPTAGPSNDKDLRQSITEKSHPPATPLPSANGFPPDLAHVTASWPRLPEHIKAAILALVKTAEG